MALPPALTAALDRLAHGRPRNIIAARAGAISSAYRSGGSSALIRDTDDALAYAFARMPATYAAVAACLQQAAARDSGRRPVRLLDVGAGPGTATFAAVDTFPSLTDFTLIDANPSLRSLALALARDIPALSGLHYQAGDAAKTLADAPEADLVVASYVIGELPDRDHAGFADALWSRTRDLLVVVEPGTPAGHARIVALRQRLVAAGGHVVAPCPHDAPCPLTPPDWCHFVQRLARTRGHMQVKGVELPFEDEKFSYVALARTAASRPAARVLAQPLVGKVDVTAKLCQADGLATTVRIARRDKPAYAAAKRWRWGDALDNET
ncbi:SAM-dependent methyltransferase [Bradyrhizobium sp. U87765 SZCCT0131]|uniref:small ribosomal subunit Rsm22 family protein n=1 Tax=unclassified Bradyrhizobium TaxID=2631580 RepID=UPI001BAA723D|nr:MULTISPECIES: small ribosomal subunit Rsm22 family protein [unclassified Bradyrhizobium]MBR1218162.1 SAM-dependent methyltransferase [Bradyrhizobium sp. U87765 SZCCT0131]MBR1260892.1 SAM-dependent methyltransferase [Bradyrhizobium sp. U87765 SZCCT0134]MBR1303660.1 SAM-dependent methyltransferase [Bradyrhizobium sp. U87765 SZCCT0110]MBR1319266.1 SAM-dependent methyltransferase [Bradyrhizobium sp. U87765 SZCCT0109]MBR1347591.1 SAM-dependent methyltransferase [Bradyrhizobium sp. U87765 SZCCT00